MNRFIVSFFGHRRLENFSFVSEALSNEIEKMLSSNSYIDFLVGRNGDFDRIVAETVRQKRKQFPECECNLIWILPYLTKELHSQHVSYQEYYNEIEICEKSSFAYPKAAFTIRNREMINRSDFVIFFVTHTSGGAFQTLEYAKEIGKPFCNLAQVSSSFRDFFR